MAKRYELNDWQWARIAGMLPGKKSIPGRTAKDNRLFVNGVLWVLRSGAQWDELPERYGKWKSVHKRFTRWAKASVWERIFAELTSDPNNEYLMLDDALGRPLRFLLTGGQVPESCTAEAMLDGPVTSSSPGSWR
jgi:putative transposase